MKTSLCNRRDRGLTLVELCVLIAVITMFFLMVILPEMDFGHSKRKVLRIVCVNNLKQSGLAFRVWAGDHRDKFPMELSETNGGTMEFTTGPNLFQHFQVMSNELGWPKVVLCPADDLRNVAATNFGSDFNNSHISFFIGLDTSRTNAQGLLSGDRNLTNGTPIRNGILEVTTNQPAGWTEGTHKMVGNLLMADGSVQQVSRTGLRNAVENAGAITNHLQMPVTP